MSCRVLNKGMEGFVLNRIIETARDSGFKEILGEYIPTARNSLVEHHYRNMGFSENKGLWTLDVASCIHRKTHIALKLEK
jgi:predicted enzyme involved in methoxymalonyl-ACP biosynthesis